MFGAVVKSVAGHAVVIVLAWAGLPQLFADPPAAETVVVVQMVAVAERRNLPSAAVAPPAPGAEPVPETAPDADVAPTEVAAAAPAPPRRREASEPAPAPRAPQAPAPEAAARPEAAPEPLPATAPRRPPTPAATETAAVRLPDDVRRPSRKPRPPPRMDFDRALERIEDIAEALPTPETRDQAPPAAEADPIDRLLASQESRFRPDAALTMTEIDAIRTQIQRNWDVPVGAADAHEMIVTLRLRLGPDGTVQSVEVVEQARMGRDSFFRTMAESAVRAVKRTARIENLSASTYRTWRDIKVRFNPKDMFG